MAKTNWQLNDTVLPSDLNDIGQEINDSTSNYVRQPAFATTAGTAGAYTVTLNPAPTIISDGFGITIVPHISNTANPTLNINGLGTIALKDQKGVAYTAGKLQAGKPYTFRKVGADFLADSSSGSGNAVAGDIRAGKTATTDNGDIVGALPVRTGGTVTPSTVNQTKQAGIYDSDIIVQGSSNLVAGNIKNGVDMFGIVGNYVGAVNHGNRYINLLISASSYIDLNFGSTSIASYVFIQSNSNFDTGAFCVGGTTIVDGGITSTMTKFDRNSGDLQSQFITKNHVRIYNNNASNQNVNGTMVFGY